MAISSATNPITRDWLVRSPIAIAFGVYPSSFTAFITAARVFSDMLVLGTSLITKETVVCDTPDRRATSPIVGRFLFLFITLVIRFSKSNYGQVSSKSQAHYTSGRFGPSRKGLIIVI